MERPRVVYFAKTKTAKVIQPSSLDGPHAPLASFELEAPIVLAEEDGTNKTSVLSKPVSQSVQDDYVSSERSNMPALSSFNSNKNVNNSKPHTYIRPRSKTFSCIPKQTTFNTENNISKQQRFSYCPASSESKSHLNNGCKITPEKPQKRTPDMQSISQDKINTNNSYSARWQDKKRDRHSQNKISHEAKRHNESSTEQNVATSSSQAAAQKPKRMYSDVSSQRQPYSFLRLSGVHDSWSHLPPPPLIKQDRTIISIEDPSEYSSYYNAKRLRTNSQTCKNIEYSGDKSGPGSFKSISSNVSSQACSEQQRISSESNKKKEVISEILPDRLTQVNSLSDRITPVKSLANNVDQVPETSKIAALNSRTNRSTPTAQVRSSQKSPFRTNSRKHFASVGCHSKPPESDSERYMKLPSTEQTIDDTRFVMNKNCQRSQTNSENIDNKLIDDSLDTFYTDHISSESKEEYLVSEFKPIWKRNSLRLATQGYTSMSDLANSLECLNDSRVIHFKSQLDPEITKTERISSPHATKTESSQFPYFTVTDNSQSPQGAKPESSQSPSVARTKISSSFHVSKAESSPNYHVTTTQIPHGFSFTVPNNSHGTNVNSCKVSPNYYITKNESSQSPQLTLAESSPSSNVNSWIISPSHHIIKTESSLSSHFPMTDRSRNPHATKFISLPSPQDTFDRNKEINLASVSVNLCANKSGLETYIFKSSNENLKSRDFALEKYEGKRKSIIDTDKLEDKLVYNQQFDRNGFKRLSYKMATLSISDLLMTDNDDLKRNYKNVTFTASQIRKSQPMKSRDSGEAHSQEFENQPHYENLDKEEGSNKIKRLSFLLATSSISDLTFPDSEVDFPDYQFFPKETGSRMSDSANSTMESTHSSIYHTPEPHRDTRGERSPSSTGRHSSFGSVYSVRGLDHSRTKASIEKCKNELKPQVNSNKGTTESVLKTDPVNDSLVSDSNTSGDSSYYYTASSDASFIAADGDPRNSPFLDDTRQRSPMLNLNSQRLNDQRFQRMLSQAQRSKVLVSRNEPPKIPPQSQRSSQIQAPGHRSQPLNDHRSHGQSLHGQDSHDPSSRDHKQWSSRNSHEPETSHNIKKTSATNQTETLKHPRPANNVFQCYGCGLDNRQHIAQSDSHWDINNSCEQSNKNQRLEKHEKANKLSVEHLKGNSSNHPPERFPVRYTERVPKDSSRLSRPSGKKDAVDRNQQIIKSLSTKQSSDSLTSCNEGAIWERTPRSPPSLGKPRRKLYAGFDSQPLPMDSFLSDSSSVYSVQSCGSWGASRSAEVESVSKTPDTSPRARAVSSIASSTYTSARDLSRDEVFDLFTFTDKHFSALENNRNLFLNVENSLVDDCFKGNFYDKTYSNESLGSHLSDTTTIGLENPDLNLDQTKPYLDHIPDQGGRYNNARCQSEKRTNETQLNKLNNSCEFDGSRLNNNGNCPAGDNRFSKNQLRSITASSRTTSPSSGFKSTENILTSKDIFDIIMTPEKSPQSGPKLLEKQAQKMTKLFSVVAQCAMQPHKNTTFMMHSDKSLPFD